VESAVGESVGCGLANLDNDMYFAQGFQINHDSTVEDGLLFGAFQRGDKEQKVD
jgi:hypothetical protein